MNRLELIGRALDTALDFGVRYAIFWALYDDGPRHDLGSRRRANDDMSGNWLIRPDGTNAL